MGLVGGSRHYGGAGLGQEGMWHCPSCGADNAGPISQGCQLCGAGRPGTKFSDPPPAPPTPTVTLGREVGHGDVADTWAETHPEATVSDAYRAGYQEGVRAARRALAQSPAAEPVYSPEGRQARTLIAALSLFRDQLLQGEPDEVKSGEWCSALEVTQMIGQLSQEVQ